MAADSAAGAHPDLPGVDPDAQEGVALDLLLTDAASQVRDRFIPGTSALKLLASLPQNPSRTGTRATSLVTICSRSLRAGQNSNRQARTSDSPTRPGGRTGCSTG
jgi:hypothetical protein